MPTCPREHRFESAELAAQALASALTASLGDAVRTRGTATIAVSGGRSPIALFEKLSAAEIAWDRVAITLVDERWVDETHADSNAALVRRHLLRDRAAKARFVPMKNAAATPHLGQTECERAIAALPLPFDAIVLGMGEDGHTASIFPQAAELGMALRTSALTVAVTPPVAPHARMSLSLHGLLRSRAIFLPIGGAAKERVYRIALGGGPVEEMPVRAVLRQRDVPVDVYLSA